MNVNNILLALLMAVIITILALIYTNMIKKESNNKKAINNLKDLVKKVDVDLKAPSNSNSNSINLGPSITNNLGPSIEGFEDDNSNNLVKGQNNADPKMKEENEKLKKYLKIHGLYPENHAVDMSKYILKTNAQPQKVCPDMSKYMLKTSVPPPVRCPKINRDEWLRKSELPVNWNKECPEHPDLTNYVLKSTIPPDQDCPACICPKVKVNAGLCREPNKDDCMKMKDVLQDACPKPEPCPKPKCPEVKCPEPDPKIYIKRSELPTDWNKECPPKEECAPCPRPPPPPKCPEPTCPTCPEPEKQGKCPEPERCPPAQNCPKCYDVKYIKVPVVKSEPLPKPNKETIFPTNLIETKLVRQQTPDKPRQPRILSLENSNNNNNNNKQVNNLNNNNNLQEDDEQINTMVEENIALAPSEVALNNSNINMAPVLSPMYDRKNNKPKNLFNKVVEKINNTFNNETKVNRKYPKELEGQCDKNNLNKAFNKFGARGFNNQL